MRNILDGRFLTKLCIFPSCNSLTNHFEVVEDKLIFILWLFAYGGVEMDIRTGEMEKGIATPNRKLKK